MSQTDHLNRLMAEIGPAVGLAAVFEIREGEEWELVLADEFSIFAEYDPSDDRLTFIGDIVDLGPDPSRDLLVKFMQYNGASTATGGVRLALDSNLHLMQVYDMPVAGKTLEDFKTVILGLADKIVAWKDALGSRVAADVAHETAAAGSGGEYIIKA